MYYVSTKINQSKKKPPQKVNRWITCVLLCALCTASSLHTYPPSSALWTIKVTVDQWRGTSPHSDDVRMSSGLLQTALSFIFSYHRPLLLLSFWAAPTECSHAVLFFSLCQRQHREWNLPTYLSSSNSLSLFVFFFIFLTYSRMVVTNRQWCSPRQRMDIWKQWRWEGIDKKGGGRGCERTKGCAESFVDPCFLGHLSDKWGHPNSLVGRAGADLAGTLSVHACECWSFFFLSFFSLQRSAWTDPIPG